MLLEKFGYLADFADEHEPAYLGVKVLDGIDELQHEARGVQHRVRNVAQDHNLRLGLFAPAEVNILWVGLFARVELNIKRHTAELQVLAQRLLDVEPTARSLLAPHGQAI